MSISMRKAVGVAGNWQRLAAVGDSKQTVNESRTATTAEAAKQAGQDRTFSADTFQPLSPLFGLSF
jgi:hypothetical protein